jgi:hypothetical protein
VCSAFSRKSINNILATVSKVGAFFPTHPGAGLFS